MEECVSLVPSRCSALRELQCAAIFGPNQTLPRFPSRARIHTAARDKVYARLLEILSGKDSTPEFQKIPFATKQAILQILLDTKKNLPAEWKS